MPTLILTPGAAATGSTKQMRIAWDNLLTHANATVTTDSETAGYEHALAYNGQAYNYWLPATGGTHYITAVFPSAQLANYFAFYGQTVYANGGSIALQYSTNAGTTWTTAASVTPSDTSPGYVVFTPVSATYWRVRVISSPASLLGVVAFGQDMILPHGCWNGFAPPAFARDTMVTNATSETGTFIGRSIVKKGSLSTLDLGYLDAGWMRTNWLPFQKWAELGPFFLLWNSVDYPLESAFCWADGAVDKPSIQMTTFMQTKFKFRCRID